MTRPVAPQHMVTRFAPSPTGRLHVGHGWSALMAMDLARAAGGTMRLRIEDIDGTRSRPEHVAAIIEDLRWLFIVTAVVTLAVNPLFGWLVSRLRRLQFIGATYGFFVLSLMGFWLLLMFAPGTVGQRSGQVFYVWLSVFNLFVTMVFWALLADRFTSDQGKRFFALISVGGTLGAILGPWLTAQLAKPLGTPNLLLVAGAFILLAIAAAWVLVRIAPDREDANANDLANETEHIGGSAWAGLRAVLQSRYLTGIAG